MHTFVGIRRAAVGAVLALGFVVAAPLSAGAAPAPGASQDTVVVTGSSGQFIYSNININAQSGTSGQNPSGTGSFSVGGSFPISGPVTCLSVTGPDMGAGRPGAPTTAILNIQSQNFGVVTVQVVDNGGNGADLISSFPFSRAATDCSPFAPGTGVEDVLTNGRAAVSDAPLLPTSKEQCKNGGYAQFGFKNQGQCIAFVNHQPQP